MLKIRQEQIEALEVARVVEFADSAFAHIQATLPDYVERAGEAAVRERLRLTLVKAYHYGFRRAHDLLRFVNASFLLGFDFDDTPKYPWVRAILNDRTVDPAARIARVQEQASEILGRRGR
jgi:hypothetical protein